MLIIENLALFNIRILHKNTELKKNKKTKKRKNEKKLLHVNKDHLMNKFKLNSHYF